MTNRRRDAWTQGRTGLAAWLRRCVSASLLSGVLSGCADLNTNPATNRIQVVLDSASFKQDIMPVLRATCGASPACHGGLSPAQGLKLDEDSAAYASLVNQVSIFAAPMMRIRPGLPDSSFMYRVLSLDPAYRLNYYRMPLTQFAVPEETRLTIRNWIQKGALYN